MLTEIAVKECFLIRAFHSLPSFLSPVLLSLAMRTDLHVCLAYTHCSHCSIYATPVNKAIQIDVLTDGSMGSGEEIERGRESSHRRTFTDRQADEQMEEEGRWRG